MADARIDSEQIYLINNWGYPVAGEAKPMDGFTGASTHNVALAARKVGTVIQVYNDGAVAGVSGLSQFVYAKLEAQDSTNVVLAKHICVSHTDAVFGDLTNEVATAVADASKWLKEQDICQVTLWNGAPISVVTPNFVMLTVTETDPGVRGDTSGGGGKPATLETGAVVRVPLFIDVDEVVKVDTRTGEYGGRAKD